MTEWNACNFCIDNDSFEGCQWGCENHEDYRPDPNKLIAKAKEKGITVSDVIALIKETNYDD